MSDKRHPHRPRRTLTANQARRLRRLYRMRARGRCHQLVPLSRRWMDMERLESPAPGAECVALPDSIGRMVAPPPLSEAQVEAILARHA